MKREKNTSPTRAHAGRPRKKSGVSPAQAAASFDRKFGPEFWAVVPGAPAVYFVYDGSGTVIYVGKAKNLRRRLRQYRNAKRRKKHFKMRAIVQEAERIDWQLCSSDLEACLLEARLIQEKRPRWNVSGAYTFLYPMIGLRRQSGELQLCYTTQPASFPGFEFHGAFRSRAFTLDAYFALSKLLGFVGHAVKARPSQRAAIPKYSYVTSFRRLPEEWSSLLHGFFRGESLSAIEELVLALVENAGARHRGRMIQDHLNSLKRFWRLEASYLARVRRFCGANAYPIPQAERDLLCLKYRYRAAEASAAGLA